jgi:hypothetical protein
LLLAVLFAILASLEVERSFMNAFVLTTISAVYLKGFLVRKTSYAFVASIIAVIFAILQTLVFLANGEISYGIVGYLSLPIVLWYRKSLEQGK